MSQSSYSLSPSRTKTFCRALFFLTLFTPYSPRTEASTIRTCCSAVVAFLALQSQAHNAPTTFPNTCPYAELLDNTPKDPCENASFACEALQKELTRQGDTLRALEGQLEVATQKNELLEETFMLQKVRIEGLEGDLKKAQQKSIYLTDTNRSLKDKIESLRTQLKSKTSIANKLENEKQHQGLTLNKKEKKIRSLQRAKDQIEQEKFNMYAVFCGCYATVLGGLFGYVWCVGLPDNGPEEQEEA